MKTVGVVGIGDMGSGLAKNLIKAGFTVRGHDLKPDRMADFANMGGIACASSAEVAQGAEAVFIMVMNGGEVNDVVFGRDGPPANSNGGLISTLDKGSAIIISATIKPSEIRQLDSDLSDSGLLLIDTPVSGGRPGAHGGTLTMMAAGSDEALAYASPAMEAVSGTIHRVGEQIGMGQTVKACLQSLIGSIFGGAFEATALAAKAGVPGQVLHDVFSTSAAGCGITNAAISTVMDRKFEDTGSHINTMHKDLTISLDMAMELGVPLFTASTAMQLFQAGRTRHPDGDNQVVARISEEIVGVGLKK
ncbi:MAG: NAD-binding protein [Rhizobiaceae bacterium]|nr:NAD-binding protein [Rhizobiaceae bacterium]